MYSVQGQLNKLMPFHRHRPHTPDPRPGTHLRMYPLSEGTWEGRCQAPSLYGTSHSNDSSWLSGISTRTSTRRCRQAAGTVCATGTSTARCFSAPLGRTQGFSPQPHIDSLLRSNVAPTFSMSRLLAASTSLVSTCQVHKPHQHQGPRSHGTLLSPTLSVTCVHVVCYPEHSCEGH